MDAFKAQKVLKLMIHLKALYNAMVAKDFSTKITILTFQKSLRAQWCVAFAQAHTTKAIRGDLHNLDKTSYAISTSNLSLLLTI